MTAELEGGEWSAARPGRTLPPGKTRYPFYKRLGGPQGRSGRAENLDPTGIRSRTVQPIALSLYRLSYPAHISIVLTRQNNIFQKHYAWDFIFWECSVNKNGNYVVCDTTHRIHGQVFIRFNKITFCLFIHFRPLAECTSVLYIMVANSNYLEMLKEYSIANSDWYI